MARKTDFDRDQALLTAVDVFWRKGYGGTSVQDLVAAMGIHRASLYEVYGSKEDLFSEVVQRYSDLVFDSAFTPLGGAGDLPTDGPILPLLGQFLGEIEGLLCHPDHPGCLVQAALQSCGEELGRGREACLDHVARFEAKISEALHAGQARGEVRRDVPVADLVEVMLGAFCGMACKSRIHRGPASLRAVREGALRAMA